MIPAVANHESRVTNHYDVIIAGASFAGLAVAQRLEGRRVVLLDRAPLGHGVTSACGAPVSIVHAVGAEGSILQVHDRLILHTSAGEAVWPLPEPFCTFDYRRFCELAWARARVEFIQATVAGRSGSTVHTSLGAFSGTFLVDATGWRAALAAAPGSAYLNRRWMAFGIESEVVCPHEPGLHFYFLPEVRDGYAWAFPAGEAVRFGVLSYLGRSRLGPALEQFMSRFGQRPAAVHGGFLASGLRPPVGGGSSASPRGLKLFIEAQASTSVPSTEKCSLEKPLDPRLRQEGSQKRSCNITRQKPVSVLRERRVIPHRIVDPNADEPAEQKVVLQPLHQLALRSDRIESLQEHRSKKLLRRNGWPTDARVKRCKISPKRRQCLVGD